MSGCEHLVHELEQLETESREKSLVKPKRLYLQRMHLFWVH